MPPEETKEQLIEKMKPKLENHKIHMGDQVELKDMLKQKMDKKIKDIAKDGKKTTTNVLDDADRTLRKKAESSYRKTKIINKIKQEKKMIALFAVLGFWAWYKFIRKPKT